MSVVEEALGLLRSCELHGHEPAGIEMTMSAWRELVGEMYHRHRDCWALTCEHDECNAYKDALRKQPGSDVGTVWLVPLHLVADQPRVRILEGEPA